MGNCHGLALRGTSNPEDLNLTSDSAINETYRRIETVSVVVYKFVSSIFHRLKFVQLRHFC